MLMSFILILVCPYLKIIKIFLRLTSIRLIKFNAYVILRYLIFFSINFSSLYKSKFGQADTVYVIALRANL